MIWCEGSWEEVNVLDVRHGRRFVTGECPVCHRRFRFVTGEGPGRPRMLAGHERKESS